ncbi:MAG: hypothetical protein JW822_00105 [Spirochaetales bacterium]|nr:hypothetical protein [Spirochaetales bacterium]
MKNTVVIVFILLLCSYCAIGGGGSPIQFTAFDFTASDQTSLSVEFDIPGDKSINGVVLTFNTNTIHSSTPLFQLTTPGSATPIYINIDNSGNPTLDLGPDPDNGKLIYLTEPSAGNYELVIVEKPEDHPRGEVGASGYYGGDEHWTFTVTGMDLCDVDGTIQSWSNDIIPVQLAEIGATPEFDIANLANVE